MSQGTYHIFEYSALYCIENDAEIVPVHYTWKVALTNLIHKQSINVKLQNEGVYYTHKIQYIS